MTAPIKAAIDDAAATRAAMAADRSKLMLVERGRTGRARAMTNAHENPLAWLVTRGLISLRQFEAGERLRCDYELAATGVRVAMRLDSIGGGGPVQVRGAAEPADPREAQIAAKVRFEGAMQAAGPGLSDVLWRTVCNCEGLEVTERDMAWPARAGKVVLGLALDRVAGFYAM